MDWWMESLDMGSTRRSRLATSVGGECVNLDSSEECDPVKCLHCRVHAALSAEALDAAADERDATLDYFRRTLEIATAVVALDKLVETWLAGRGPVERVRPQDLGWREVNELDIPSRAAFALFDNEIQTLGDLVKRSADELLEVRGIGSKGLQQIQDGLRKFGLVLRELEAK